jgi:hypothetical protein
MGWLLLIVAYFVLLAYLAKRFIDKRKQKKLTRPSAEEKRELKARKKEKRIHEVLVSAGCVDAHIPDMESFEIPSGERSITVYVYDGRPLINTGDSYTLTSQPRVRKMVSQYTGTEWTDDCPLACRGVLVGFMGDGVYADLVKDVVRKYKYVTVHANTFGNSKEGWPIVKLSVPYMSWFKDIANCE